LLLKNEIKDTLKLNMKSSQFSQIWTKTQFE